MFKISELRAATSGKITSLKKDCPVSGLSIDSRTIKRGEGFIAVKGDKFDGHDYIRSAIEKGATCVIQSRARTPRQKDNGKTVTIEVKDTTEALCDIARFQRNKFNIPLIAVTGSTGKTTVKEMIALVLSGKLNILKNEGTKNNKIGLSLTLLGLNASHEAAVVELGTNHFNEIEHLAGICSPNVGIITNIGPGHLEYFRDLAGVLREKYSLLNYLKAPHLAVLNADDLLLSRKSAKKSSIPFIVTTGITSNADFHASAVNSRGYDLSFSLNRKYRFGLNIAGRHNIYNALSAIAVARIFGLSCENIARRLSMYKCADGRMTLKMFNGAKFIDDTYNSNPLSLRRALETLADFRVKGRKIFVMGDMLELGKNRGRLHALAGETASLFCDIFVSVGELSRLAASRAKSRGFRVKNVFCCSTPEEARSILFDKIDVSKDDLVLVKGSRAMKMEKIFK